IGQALDAYIDQLATLASESAVVAAASDGTPAAVSLLIELAETEPAITSLGYTNRTGLIVAATNSVSADSSASGLWDQAWARSVGIGPVSPTEGGATNAGAGLPVAVRIDDVLGVPVGVLTATIDVEFIQAITDFRLEAGVSVTVLSTDGILLAETDSDHSNQRIGIADLDPDALSNGIRQAQETVEGSLVNT
ncbi:MAG: hypothetical protein GY929_15805, partial [Actinomycetia bacterium]|nr:hypothetical protein [Actinomycetes bacterium]